MKSIIYILALCGTAYAEPKLSAEDLYEQGQRAYDHGDYAEAILAWQASFTLAPEATDILFDIAQAYRLHGDCSHALETYRQYIVKQSANNSTLASHLALSKEFIRSLVSICEKSKTDIVPISTELARESAHKPFEPVRESIVRHQKSSNHSKLVGLAVGGAGLALVVTGLGFNHHATTLNSQVTNACTISCDWSIERNQTEISHRDALIGWTLDAVGVGALLGGAALYYFGGTTHGFSLNPGSNHTELSWGTSW